MADTPWSGLPRLESDPVEDSFFDVITGPLDCTVRDISDGNLMFDSLWSEPSMFQLESIFNTGAFDLGCNAAWDYNPNLSPQINSLNTTAFADLSTTSATLNVVDIETSTRTFPTREVDEVQRLQSTEFPQGQKRFEECLYEFEGWPPSTSSRRKRRKFSCERRKEVSQMRKVGACVRCKLTKSPCKLDSPCPACIKASGDPNLGRVLCTRQSLLNIRFTLDLWHRSSAITWLQEQVTSLSGPTWTIKISFRSSCYNDLLGTVLEVRRPHETPPNLFKRASPLEISVQAFVPRNQEQHAEYLCDADYHEYPRVSPQCYAIPSESLPSLSEIEVWALDTMFSYPMFESFGGFRSSIFQFARNYYESEKCLAGKDLLRRALQLTALHSVWSHMLHIQREDQSMSEEHTSVAVHVQLQAIISQGIIDLEVSILSDLQKSIFGLKGPGKRNMVPIWTCLWLLLLVYRETIDCWFPQNHVQECSQLAKQLYDMLVSIYSGLFGPSSPLRLNWLVDNVYELFIKDHIVMRSMGTVKTEFVLFDKFRFHNHKKDALLRSLIFEREMKGMKRPFDPLSQSYYESSRVYQKLRVVSRDPDANLPPEPIV